MAKIFIYCVLSIALLAVQVGAVGEIHIFDNDSLPKTLGAEYEQDTIKISGTKISAAADGILVNIADVVLDFGVGANRDTLEFNTGGGDDKYGVKITTDGTGCVIRGGVILCSADSVDTGNVCVNIVGPPDLTFDSVYAQSAGFEAFCLAVTTTDGTISNIVVNSGRYLNFTNGNAERDVYIGVGIHVLGPAHQGSDKTLTVDGAFVFSNSASIRVEENGFDLPYFEIKNCTLSIDARNDYYDGTNQGDMSHSSANTSAIGCDGIYEGSSIHDNILRAGTPVDTLGNVITLDYDGVISYDSLFYGSDDMIAVTSVAGTSSDPVRVYNNTFVGWRGRDAHYNESWGSTLVCKAIKARQLFGTIVNSWFLFYDNDITLYAKGDSDYVHMGHSAVGVGWHFWDDENGGEGTQLMDTAIQFYNNTIDVISLGEGANPEDTIHLMACWGGLGNGSQDEWYVRGNRWWGNPLTSSKYIYSMGLTAVDEGDGGFTGFRAENDTIGTRADTVDNPAVFVWGYNTTDIPSGNTNHIFTDLFYTGVIDDTRQEYISGDDSSSFKLRRTVSIYVEGADDLPVDQADVWGVNDYGDTVIQGQTDASGNYSAVVTYEWRTSGGGGDSLRIAFNNFVLGAQKAADTTVNIAFTVDHTAAGGNDTLKLEETSFTAPMLPRRRLLMEDQ